MDEDGAKELYMIFPAGDWFYWFCSFLFVCVVRALMGMYIHPSLPEMRKSSSCIVTEEKREEPKASGLCSPLAEPGGMPRHCHRD